jgi:glycosyltransferase involved in cell wall biosynthesis
MRIAIGIHSLQLGGSQINTVDLASGLRDRGHDVHLFVIHQEFKVTIAPLVERAGFELEVLPPESSLRRQARHLRAVVDRHRSQVLHVYHEDHWLGPLAAIALRPRPGRALVVTNWMMENNRWLPPWAPLVVGTEALREEATSLQRGPVWLLEPPVDIDRDAPDPARAAEFRSTYGLGERELVVVLVTRVDRLMKLDGILRAIAATRRSTGTDVRLVIVGDGDAMETVRRAADEANAELGREAVTLTGALVDPRPAYDAADVVLAMGGSALRALAFGKPLIVVGEGSFSRVFSPETASYFLRHGYHGVEHGDMSGADLAEQIASLRDPEVRAKLGAFGASTVRERYALDVVTHRLEKIYADALASPRTGRQRWGDVAYVWGYDFVHRRFPPAWRQAIRRRIARLRTA